MIIINLGYVVSSEEANHLSGASIAGNKMQWNVLNCLSQYNNLQIIPITIKPIAYFPRDKKLYQKRTKMKLSKKLETYIIPFINLPIIKQFYQTFSVYFEAKKLIKKYPDAVIFCFNLFPQIGLPMKWLKKKYGCKTICLLADLPFDDNEERYGVSTILRNYFDKITWKCIKICDFFIILNRKVADQYLKGKKYVVVEGGVEETDIIPIDKIKKNTRKNLFYCGSLTPYNGIENLIKAMDQIIDLDIELHIYGNGILEKKVIEASQKNKKIKYFGKINNDDVRRLQSEAWLLINPRSIENPISKVTFPSKTFEYLLSGTPLLTTRLNGYTEEYQDKMLFTEGDTPNDLAESIRKVNDMKNDVLLEMAKQGREFVIERKIWTKQTQKIYDFITKKIMV